MVREAGLELSLYIVTLEKQGKAIPQNPCATTALPNALESNGTTWYTPKGKNKGNVLFVKSPYPAGFNPALEVVPPVPTPPVPSASAKTPVAGPHAACDSEESAANASDR